MNPLYFISNQSYSGKSTLCVGIGKLLKKEGLKVGYMKPVGNLPVRIGDIVTDEDAQYISEILDIEDDLKSISPVVLTKMYYREGLNDEQLPAELLKQISGSYTEIKNKKDIVILEGARSVYDGYSFGVTSKDICKKLKARCIFILRYNNEIIDQILYTHEYLKDCLSGVIINWIPENQLDYLKEFVIPFLEKKNIKVFGYITSDKMLSSVSIKEIAKLLEGRIICAEEKSDRLIESFMVGAMGQEQALKFFKKRFNKAVVTGGDRADVQLAALETQTECLILTGNFQPSSVILDRAKQIGVPIVMVDYDTLTTIGKLNEIIGHVRFHEYKKIDKIINVVKDNINIKELIGLSKSNRS